MTTTIIKGIIAIIIIAAATASVFIGDNTAQTFLIPLGTFVVGYYFKQVETPIVAKYLASKSKSE